MFPGKAASRFFKTTFTHSNSVSTNITIGSEPLADGNGLVLAKDRRVDSALSCGAKERFADRASLARTRAASNETARPETKAKPAWQAPRITELPMSSDLARHAAARILHAQGRHAEALGIATAVLASQKARPSTDPTPPGIAASRALVGEIRRSLRREKRSKG